MEDSAQYRALQTVLLLGLAVRLAVSSCSYPGDLANGRVIGQDYSTGSQIRFECDEGYQLAGGSSLSTCLADGTWSWDLPTCNAITCQEVLTTPDHATMVVSGSMYGSTATVTCNVGYSLATGNATRVCGGTGQWSGTAPTCAEINCGVPVIPQGSAILDNGQTTYTALSKFECDAGTTREDSTALTDHNGFSECTIQGQWYPNPPDCLKGCVAPPPGYSTSVTGSQVHNTEVPISCPPDKTLQGSTKLLCNNGTWETPAGAADPACAIPGADLGIIVGVCVAAFIVLLVYGLLVWSCRRRVINRGYEQDTNYGPVLQAISKYNEESKDALDQVKNQAAALKRLFESQYRLIRNSVLVDKDKNQTKVDAFLEEVKKARPSDGSSQYNKLQTLVLDTLEWVDKENPSEYLKSREESWNTQVTEISTLHNRGAVWYNSWKELHVSLIVYLETYHKEGATLDNIREKANEVDKKLHGYEENETNKSSNSFSKQVSLMKSNIESLHEVIQADMNAGAAAEEYNDRVKEFLNKLDKSLKKGLISEPLYDQSFVLTVKVLKLVEKKNRENVFDEARTSLDKHAMKFSFIFSSAWIDSWREMLQRLQEYVTKYHTTGLTADWTPPCCSWSYWRIFVLWVPCIPLKKKQVETTANANDTTEMTPLADSKEGLA